MNVAVDVPLLREVGEKETVTPDTLEAESVTVELNPLDGVTLIVEVPLLPAATVRDDGEAERLNEGCAELEPVRAAMSPLLGLPHPVTRSYPVTAE